MKRTTAAYLTAAAMALGLAAMNPSPAACQTMVNDELMKVRTHGYPVEIEIWVDKGEDATYREGEEVRVRFRTDSDCYVVIYDIDTEGFLNLLYPDYPGDDGFVEGGVIHRLPHPGARYELLAEGPPGVEYIAAVASEFPLAPGLPWYLAESYETAGYRGYDDIESSISDVGAVRGDPYVAMQDIAYDILPEDVTEREYDTAYTFFNVGREYRHPRYLCYDCHGHVSWFDPYYDSCSVFEIRVDLDWRFISHPTCYYVAPRFWYWNVYDGHHLYVGFPDYWCSLYPRHLYRQHYWDYLHKAGPRNEGPGNVYLPPRYRGKPGHWENDRRDTPPPGYYTKGPEGGGKDVDRRGLGEADRKYGRRGKPDSSGDVKQPERLVKLDGVRLGSDGDGKSRAGALRKVERRGETAPGNVREATREPKARVEGTRTESRSKPKLKIVKKSGDRDKSKADAQKGDTSRSGSETKASKAGDSGGRSDAGAKSSTRSDKSSGKRTDEDRSSRTTAKRTARSR